MGKYCKYDRYRRYVSYDGGLTWNPLNEFVTGELIEENSLECGYEFKYRWELSESEYQCDGYDKYSVEVYQISYDDGMSWSDAYPRQTRKGSIIERNSTDCGYKPIEPMYRWVEVEGEYECEECPYDGKLKVTYKDGSTREVPCNDDSTFGSDEAQPNETDRANMVSAEIGECVTRIGGGTFDGCYALTSVTIGTGVATMGWRAFGDCSGLTSITIPDNVTSIGGDSFNGCTGLKTVTIGTGVTTILNNAFDSCTGLISVTILAETPPSLEFQTFYNTNNCPIYVPDASVNVYKTVSRWSEYSSRIKPLSEKP